MHMIRIRLNGCSPLGTAHHHPTALSHILTTHNQQHHSMTQCKTSHNAKPPLYNSNKAGDPFMLLRYHSVSVALSNQFSIVVVKRLLLCGSGCVNHAFAFVLTFWLVHVAIENADALLMHC